MYCKQCGAELPSNTQDCSKCGMAVADTPAETQVIASPENKIETALPHQRVSPWKVWMWIVGLFLIILLVRGLITDLQRLYKYISTKAVIRISVREAKNPKDGATMVWVPGATFTMGGATKVEGLDDEYPAHQVTLSGYWIYKYDITVEQYRAFCAATTRALPEFPRINYYSWIQKTGWDAPELQQHPIVNVTWHDAKAYADWAGVRMPTEAQWEYAARGPQGNNYPWGGRARKNDMSNGWDETKCANYYNSQREIKSTWPVGSFPAGASWCGAQDIAGNVGQWCGDWYSDYTAAAVTDPTGPDTGNRRVLRGGSWYGSIYDYRGTHRGAESPDVYDIGIGFRCAVIAPGP